MSRKSFAPYRLIAQSLPLTLFGAVFALYVATLAPSIVPGDPGEYQFIPHIMGIAHPPGYAFYTLLAKTWTTLVRIGSIAYRTNLLSAVAGAWTVLMVYAIVQLLLTRTYYRRRDTISTSGTSAMSHRAATKEPAYLYILPALFAAATLAVSTDLWQHSIHANSHIVSAALSATTLYIGLRWWATGRPLWLYAFAFLGAAGVTHHPLLAFGLPACVVFGLTVQPDVWRNWGRLLGVMGAFLLGLGFLLYLPLRAGATPFGPSPTWDAILGHATARGIRGNLFYFGLADQIVRLRVFGELLRLQFTWPVIVLALIGTLRLARERLRPFILLFTFFMLNLAFTINTVQDVMAYLLLPFTTIAIFAGIGASAILDLLQTLRLDRSATEGAKQFPVPDPTRSGAVNASNSTLSPLSRFRPLWRPLLLATFTLFLVLSPLLTALHRAPRLSLRDYCLADRYVQAVYEQFAGQGEGAVLLASWEGLTPLWYAQYVERRSLSPSDVQLDFVASGTANPWVEKVWAHIEDGPIYLSDYRPQVVAEGFRLRPVGEWPFYKVEPPPAKEAPTMDHTLDLWAEGRIHILGWDLDRSSVRAGETAYLTLYMSAPEPLEDYYMPYLWVGDRLYRWTTDSRLNTPWWQPGEIIVERYPITIPFNTPAEEYALALGVSNVSQGQDLLLSNGAETVRLSTPLYVQTAAIAPDNPVLTAALANINSDVVLLGGRASVPGQTFGLPWDEPLTLQPGDSIQVWLNWQSLTAIDEPYTVFVHLIDGAGWPWAQHDYTPMGGAFPTFLWIPRWIEGQRLSDPYKLTVPLDAPPGDYWLEVGMYGMTSLRRAHHFDQAGNLAGDRYVLGPVRIQADQE